jgi:hypothetical protein
VEMSTAEVCVLFAFIVCFRFPVSLRVVDGAVVVYARGEEIWGAFLRFGGLDGEHVGDGVSVILWCRMAESLEALYRSYQDFCSGLIWGCEDRLNQLYSAIS